VNSKHHKNICYAPFIHNYIHPNDGPQLCCESGILNSKHTEESLDLENFWTSDYYQKVRQDMLDGKKLSACRSCWQLEEQGIESDRSMYNEKYKKHGSPELDVVAGTSIGKPVDFDIRPSNLCNLKCRMCTPSYSSQLDKEVKKNPFLKQPWYNTGGVENFNIMTDKNIDYLVTAINDESDLKFLGGEPTIMPEVSTILDKLIENNKTDCHINLTTNCTNFNNQAMFDKLAKFESVSTQLSIDGMGKTLEYIRFPVNWKKAQEVMLQWVNITNHREIHFTLQSLNLFNVYDFLFWLADFNKKIDSTLDKIEYNDNGDSRIQIPVEFYNLEEPSWASIKHLPIEARHKEMERILSISDPYVIRLMNESRMPLVGCLKPLLEDDFRGLPHRLALSSKYFDHARKQHIKDYVPEIYNLIKRFYNEIPYPRSRD
jgi:organic radical activating enzyme